jgi:ankyrin repeat protein
MWFFGFSETTYKVVSSSKPIAAVSALLSKVMILPINKILSAIKYCIQNLTFEDVKAGIALWTLTYKACAVKKISYQEASKSLESLDNQTLKKAIYLNTNAQNVINHVNEQGLNLPQQAAAVGNFEAVKIMLNGVHNGIMATIQDMANNPTHIMDIVLHLTEVDKTVFIESRKIFEGLTDQQINAKILTGIHAGETLLHIEAQSFKTLQDLMVIEQTVQKGGDVTSQDKNGNTPLVQALQNTQVRVKAINVVKVFTADSKELVEAALPIATDANKAELINPVIEYAKTQNNMQELLTPLIQPAIISGNLEVIKALHKNGIELKDDQIVKISKLIEDNLNPENLDFEVKLLHNINNKQTIKAIENTVTTPELLELCEARENAIDSKFNQNFMQIFTKGIFSYGEKGLDLSQFVDFTKNKTVPISQKLIAIAASLPSMQTLLCEFVIEKAVNIAGDTAELLSERFDDVAEDVNYIGNLEDNSSIF